MLKDTHFYKMFYDLSLRVSTKIPMDKFLREIPLGHSLQQTPKAYSYKNAPKKKLKRNFFANNAPKPISAKMVGV